MITDELKQIAYNEGCQAFVDDVCLTHNPYDGVSDTLREFWYEGWWDNFYDDEV